MFSCLIANLQVRAVLDWELATLGNPWADVAYMAMPYHLPAVLSSLCLRQPVPGGLHWLDSPPSTLIVVIPWHV